MRKHWLRAIGTGAVAALVLGGIAWAGADFGAQVQQQLHGRSNELFGVGKPLEQSSTASISQQDALANPNHLLTLAGGLKAKAVTAGTAPSVIDQIAMWPDETHPQWLIACNEQGTTDPGLIRVNLATGEWATILTGTTSCDPVRLTPWGTILFGEEAGGGTSGGAMYELGDPLNTTGVTLDRTTGTFSGGIGADNLVARYALGRLSFDGLAIYSNGLVYYGDENRPSGGTAGGAYFKFIPTTILHDEVRHISSLEIRRCIANWPNLAPSRPGWLKLAGASSPLSDARPPRIPASQANRPSIVRIPSKPLGSQPFNASLGKGDERAGTAIGTTHVDSG